MIYINYGYGKGKTTAAIGTALRALHNKETVLFCSFLKDNSDGALKELKNKDGLYWVTMNCKNLKLEDCNDFLARVKAYGITADKYNLIILDEVLVALDKGLLDINNLESFIHLATTNNIDIYMTGRVVNHKWRIWCNNIGDIVSNTFSEKHCFDKQCTNCANSLPYYFQYCPHCGKKLPKNIKAKKGREY